MAARWRRAAPAEEHRLAERMLAAARHYLEVLLDVVAELVAQHVAHRAGGRVLREAVQVERKGLLPQRVGRQRWLAAVERWVAA